MSYDNNKYMHQSYKTYYGSDSRVPYQHIKANFNTSYDRNNPEQ